MVYVWATLLSGLNVVWLLLTVVGVPGTWLMVLTTLLVAWWQWNPALTRAEQMFSVEVLVTVAVLALLGELVELIAGLIGAQRAGSTRWGVLGAFVGTLVGGIAGTFAIPLPLFGSLLGACAGAALGTVVFEIWTGRPTPGALRSGMGAGVGRLTGTVGKLVVGAAMWLVITWAAFWP